jgi:hypothetical protein
MKKIVALLSVFCVLLGACTRKNYVTNIPRPHFEYHESSKKLPANTQEVPPQAVVVNEKPVANEVAESLTVIPQEEATQSKPAPMVLASTTPNSNGVKKMTLKHKLFSKLYSSKTNAIQKGVLPTAKRNNKAALIGSAFATLAVAYFLILIITIGEGAIIPILLGLAASVLGGIGRSKIRRSYNEKGMGWAWFAIIAGVLAVVFSGLYGLLII